MTSPFLNSEEAAEFLRFVKKDGTADVDNLRRFLKRHQVQGVARGRRLLYRKDDLLDILAPRGPRTRRAS